MSAQPELLSAHQTQVPADLEALFNTNDYVDLSALDSTNTTPNIPNQQQQQQQYHSGFTPRPDQQENLAGMQYNDIPGGEGGQMMMGEYHNDLGMTNNNMTFDFGNNGVGFGGEMLAGEGMDTVSDGLRDNDPNQGL